VKDPIFEHYRLGTVKHVLTDDGNVPKTSRTVKRSAEDIVGETSGGEMLPRRLISAPFYIGIVVYLS
jgi:hypothetical protein